jgi:ribosomal protein S18 acetylase RimI-like enzyme
MQADGVPVGWALVNTMPHEVRVVEIMVLPERRGRGIGTAAFDEILSTAASARKPVRLNVNILNQRAIRLYERLGFRKVDQDAVQYLMEFGC